MPTGRYHDCSKMVKHGLIAISIATGGLGLTVAASAAEITITKEAPKSNTQLAIVPFAGADALSRVISNDLTQLGQFVQTQALPETPHSSREVTLPVWQHQAVPYLVVGNTRSNRGEVEINFEVIEVATGAIMQGPQQIKSRNSADALRLAGHQVADRIYEILTGVRGDFSGKIAYVVATGSGAKQQSSLVVSDVDGYNPKIIQQLNGTIKALNPSADGRHFAYVGQAYNGYPVVYVADVVSGSSTLVTPYRANNLGGSVSPDGTRLLFSSDKDGNPDIYLANINGGNVQRIISHPLPDMYPSWSPDGQSFVFTSDRNGNNRGQIYRYQFATGAVQPLTGGRLNAMGRISNDGKKMTYLAGTDQGAVMDLASRSVTPLNNVGMSEAPSLSPNGQHFIYSGRNVITIVSNGNTVSINPRQNGVPAGTIYSPIWLNPDAKPASSPRF